MPRWAVLVIEHDGEQHYICAGAEDDGPVATFASRDRAERTAEFWREGLGDEVQSVNVVPYSPPQKEQGHARS